MLTNQYYIMLTVDSAHSHHYLGIAQIFLTNQVIQYNVFFTSEQISSYSATSLVDLQSFSRRDTAEFNRHSYRYLRCFNSESSRSTYDQTICDLHKLASICFYISSLTLYPFQCQLRIVLQLSSQLKCQLTELIMNATISSVIKYSRIRLLLDSFDYI